MDSIHMKINKVKSDEQGNPPIYQQNQKAQDYEDQNCIVMQAETQRRKTTTATTTANIRLIPS